MRTTLKTIALLFGLAAALDAQQDRIAGAVDRTRVITLKGNRHPGVGPQNDQGLVTPEFALSGMTLLFKQSPAQESALQQLIAEQQNPASVNYRRWLTPDQYADRFGVSHNDIAKVTAWLKSEGFAVGTVARGRNWMVFSGTARQVQQTFRTEIHRYLVGGELHYANAAEPSIPSVLGDVVSGIDGLDDFYLKPASVGQPLRPTFNSGSGAHFLAPDDLATIYDIAPLYSAGIDGTGQKVVVVGETALSDTALMDVAAFRTRFNLPANVPNTVLDPDYPDPGIVSGDVDTEAHLDLELIGSVARNATIIYVYSGSVFHAIEYAIDHDLAPVISVSFIGCESESVHSLAFLQSVARQANSMGITWINGSGDAGPASCDRSGAPVAQDGLDVGLPQDIPEVTAVGGTKFDEADGTFWGNSNSPNGSSAVSYIPERVWNDVPVYNGIVAGGGGASSYFTQPPWQTGPGVPNDGVRHVPDVALAASAVHDGYYTVLNGKASPLGGTSASTPVFAGIVTLLNQYLISKNLQSQPGLGNINPALYRLAQNTTGVFHDVTTGDNAVPCAPGSPSCTNGTIGYSAGPGYDLATGLGSVDAYNFVTRWSSQPPAGSTIVITSSATTVYQQPPDAQGNQWHVGFTIAEEAGVGATLTGFLINGANQDLSLHFQSTAIPANGLLSGSAAFPSLNVPATLAFGFTGVDAKGNQWSQQVSVNFDGPLTPPSIAGVANSASFQPALAPGMLMYIAGANLTAITQSAAVVPLLDYMGGIFAAVNGIATPFFYLSPTTLIVQVPYEIAPGPARLTVSNVNQSASFSFTVQPAAPGIFTTGSGYITPVSSGSPGQIISLYMTGQGQVSPAVATGAGPSANTPLNNLPSPTLPVSVTVAGLPAQIIFHAIPAGLVGVMLVNFEIPMNAPSGPQPVVVMVGDAASQLAMLNITPSRSQ